MRLPASVLILTAVALVLRVIGLDSQLWYDEIWTVVRNVRQPLEVVVTTFPVENHTLYSVLAKGTAAVLGEEPWVVRLWSVLFGVLSVPVVYALGRLITDPREALAAAVLLTVSYHHIWFSQNARGYTGLLLATLVTSWCFLNGLRRGGWRFWLIYALVAALGAYMHLTMILVVVAHVLVLAVLAADKRRRPSAAALKRAGAGIALSGALTLALYAPLVVGAVEYLVVNPGRSVYANPLQALSYAVIGLRSGYGLVGMVAGAAIVLLGIWSYLRQDYPVLLLLILPGALSLAVMLALRSAIHPRYFFFAVGPVLLILTRGLAVAAAWIARLTPVDRGPQARRVVFAGFVALAVLASLPSYRRLYALPKQDYVGAMRFVESSVTPEDAIATIRTTAVAYVEYYRKPWIVIDEPERLEATVTRPGRTWILTTFERVLREARSPEMEIIRREFVPVRTFWGTQKDGEVKVWVERDRGDPRSARDAGTGR